MPSNCSADVQAVISHVDQVFSGNNATAIQALKDSFGMGAVTHLDDVAGTRMSKHINLKIMFLYSLWQCEITSGTGNHCR